MKAGECAGCSLQQQQQQPAYLKGNDEGEAADCDVPVVSGVGVLQGFTGVRRVAVVGVPETTAG